MAQLQLTSFERPSDHQAISDIIRRRSTNPADVREAFLDRLDISGVRTVLDLGCGFGFMTEAVARRVAPAARIVGVDACAANEAPFLARVAATGRTARFAHHRIDRRLDWPDGCFDLVVASYALYFFPRVLPEVARVLAPSGLFLAVTHTEASCRALADLLGTWESDSLLDSIVRRFSADNGAAVLAPWFQELERVEYHNELVFGAADRDDLLAYLRFKLELAAPRAFRSHGLTAALVRATAVLADRGRIVLPKDDVAFRCTRPRCR